MSAVIQGHVGASGRIRTWQYPERRRTWVTNPERIQPSGLAGSIEFIRLEETLREFAEGEAFVFVVNQGNWGTD